MPPTKRAARVAGLLYLLVVLTGPFVLMYVPGKLFVSGNAAATAGNIVAHQTLSRAHIVVGLASELLFIAVVLALYRLLAGVGRELAAVMVILVLVDAPLAFAGIANEVATLALLRGGETLAAFDAPQRAALATLLVTAGQHGQIVSEVFWGLWLLPLGILVWRSGFLPRFIGAWLLVNGLAYVALSAIELYLPQRIDAAFTAATPLLLGEVALTFWLLIAGVRVLPRGPAAPHETASPRT